MTVAELEGSDVVLYLLDYEQIHLIPLQHPRSSGEEVEPLRVEGTLAGRAFASGSPLAVQRDEVWQVWIPVTERADRLGVVSMQLPAWDDEVEEFCLELGLAAAYLLQSASRYSDQPERLRRVQDMSLAAEIQWGLLPPPRSLSRPPPWPACWSRPMRWVATASTSRSTTGHSTSLSSTRWGTACPAPCWPPLPSAPTATPAASTRATRSSSCAGWKTRSPSSTAGSPSSRRCCAVSSRRPAT